MQSNLQSDPQLGLQNRSWLKLPTIVLFALAASAHFLGSGCEKSAEQQMLRSAESLMDHNQLDRAFTQLDEFYRQNPKAHEARQLQVVILLKQRKVEEAIDMYNHLRANTAPVTFLNENIRNDDPVVRAGLCVLIARTKPSNAVYLLTKAAHDPNREVRRASVQGLGRYRGKKVRLTLEQSLIDSAWQVRADAADALETLGDPAAAQSLFQSMLDDDGYVRFKTRCALESLIADSNISVYRRALKHGNHRVRIAAAIALAKRQDDDALGPLYEALKDKDATQRVAAVRALAALGDRSARPLLRESLRDSSAEVRARAALSLAELGDVASTNSLAFLANTDPVEAVRLAAAQAFQFLSPATPFSEMVPR